MGIIECKFCHGRARAQPHLCGCKKEQGTGLFLNLAEAIKCLFAGYTRKSLYIFQVSESSIEALNFFIDYTIGYIIGFIINNTSNNHKKVKCYYTGDVIIGTGTLW